MGSIGASKGTSYTAQEKAVMESALQGNEAAINEMSKIGLSTTKDLQNYKNERNKQTAIPKSQVEVNDSEFKTYNGRPSGTGTWSFNINGEDVFYSGKYSSAKAQAIEEAARRGIRRIKLNT